MAARRCNHHGGLCSSPSCCCCLLRCRLLRVPGESFAGNYVLLGCLRAATAGAPAPGVESLPCWEVIRRGLSESRRKHSLLSLALVVDFWPVSILCAVCVVLPCLCGLLLRCLPCLPVSSLMLGRLSIAIALVIVSSLSHNSVACVFAFPIATNTCFRLI